VNPSVIASDDPDLAAERLRDGLPEQLGEQAADAGADHIDDRPDLLHRLAGGISQFPIEVALAGIDGQASPQPMVTITSAARAGRLSTETDTTTTARR
jgi:hypothetical protein